MKKILSIILTIFAVTLACFSVGCDNKANIDNQSNKTPLEFDRESLVVTVSNITTQYDIKDIIVFESEDEKDKTKISATSENESVVKIVNGCIVPGKEFGKTNVQVFTDKKVGTIEVEFVSIYKYWSRFGEKYQEDLLACAWFSNHRNAFKNPDSIEVLQAWKHTSNGSVDFFMLEVRGENSFGGNSIEYLQLSYSGFSDGYSPYIFSYILADGFSYSSVTYSLNVCIEEYRLGLH
ncbi:MAG: hypothetical protein IKD14_01790 [Clostridia bacterium]|nr:hypothetical protein [Clostridia bacterium]